MTKANSRLDAKRSNISKVLMTQVTELESNMLAVETKMNVLFSNEDVKEVSFDDIHNKLHDADFPLFSKSLSKSVYVTMTASVVFGEVQIKVRRFTFDNEEILYKGGSKYQASKVYNSL